MSKDISTDVNEGVIEKFLVDQDGNVVTLDDLIIPQYSNCKRCPLEHCPMRWSKDEAPDGIDYCRIEQGLIIEATKEHLLEGGDLTSKIALMSVFNNLLLVHRAQRVGAMIDYTQLVDDPKMLQLLERYSMITSRHDSNLMRALKEFQMTPKEKDKKKEQKVNTAAILQELFERADRLSDKQVESLPETETEKDARLRPSYEDEMDEHDIAVNNRDD